MIKFLLIIIIAVVVSAGSAFSHPGRTDKNGCHYCRTNCEKWGVPKNQKHCHYKAEPMDFLKIENKVINKKVLQSN